MNRNELIGYRIRERRIELGLTQKQLAKLVGYTSHTTVAKVERGLVDLSQSKIAAFTDALQVDAGYLVWGKEATQTDASTDEWREELRSNPDLRMLLSASSKLNEDDIKYLIALAERMNRE